MNEPVKSLSAYGTIAFRLGIYAVAFLPQRVAHTLMDAGARVLFGPAEPVEFTSSMGKRVSL